MAGIVLSQVVADGLLAVPKRKVDDSEWHFPYMGGKISIPLISLDEREEFFLDLHRGRINLAKSTSQNRGRRSIILARLDVAGPPHRNPDDTEVSASHLHIYIEGYDDKWAVPAPCLYFHNLGDIWQTLHEFMHFVNVVDLPNIRQELLP